jgi:hypothetical protein
VPRHFSAILIAALIASDLSISGCSQGTTPSVAAPAASPQERAATRHPLVYISFSPTNSSLGASVDVFVYDYVTGRRVQQLLVNGFVGCADTTGNVYVLHAGNPGAPAALDVYPHGGNKPSSSLAVPIAGQPLNCSISPVDGDLAVSYLSSFTGSGSSSGNGFLLVYHRAQGQPKVYRDALLADIFGEAAYDAHGDIYLSESGVGRFAELRRGAHSIVNITPNVSIGNGYAGIWAFGTQLVAWPFQAPNTLQRFNIHGNTAKSAGSTTFNGSWGIRGLNFTFYKSSFVAAVTKGSFKVTGSGVAFYNYPAGGPPVRVITIPARYSADAVVVSP